MTQFELLTAAALWEMAEQDVEVAVVEAGLGGRYDATSVIDARRDGADQRRPRAHPLARPDGDATSPRRSSPSCGRARRSCSAPDLAPEALAVAERVAAERDARDRDAPRRAEPRSRCARGAFQRRNFALARAAAEALPARGRDRARRAGGARARRPRPRCPGACRCVAAIR